MSLQVSSAARTFVARRAPRAAAFHNRLLGKAQLLSDRRLSPQQRWLKRLGNESDYWTRVIRTPGLLQERFGDRLDPAAEIRDPGVCDAIERIPRSRIRLLDVGAGPLTSLGKTYPGRDIEVVAIDPLADNYNAELRRIRAVPPVVTRALSVEQVIDTFGPRSFDISFSENAIDHMPDPLSALDTMIAATAPDGFIVLRCKPNEGERNSYFGIHQWNVDCIDGDLVVWNRSVRSSVGEHVRGRAECLLVQSSGGWVKCILRPSRDARDGDTG